MKRSTNRILTTHAGRLNGPPELTDATRAITRGDSDIDAAMPLIRKSMADIVKQQADAGIDIVSDGELGKIGWGLNYYGKRLSGLAARPVKEGEANIMANGTGERIEFADFYNDLARQMGNLGAGTPATTRNVVDGPLKYIGEAEVAKDIELFKTALTQSGAKVEETFMCVLAPGWLEHFFYNEYYKTDEEYLFALGEAMRTEYKAVIDAGFILQLDDPGLPDTYDMIVPNPSIEDYRKFAEIRIEAMNIGLKGLPADRIRYHICWGSWHGPHTHDLPLVHVVDLMLKINAEAYSIEAANPRHEHEWKVWKDVKLPEGKILIPGVVSHASNVVEHPELVADRIVQYASLVGKENVIAGTDCGMGNRVHYQIGWAKLKALGEGAELASKQLWS